jgi:hypothetical protein
VEKRKDAEVAAASGLARYVALMTQKKREVEAKRAGTGEERHTKAKARVSSECRPVTVTDLGRRDVPFRLRLCAFVLFQTLQELYYTLTIYYSVPFRRHASQSAPLAQLVARPRHNASSHPRPRHSLLSAPATLAPTGDVQSPSSP